MYKRVEWLHYPTKGVNKDELEGMDYPLKDTQALAKEQLDAAKQIFKEAGLPVGWFVSLSFFHFPTKTNFSAVCYVEN